MKKVNQLAKEWGNKLEIIAAGTLIGEIIYVPQKIITEYTPQTKKIKIMLLRLFMQWIINLFNKKEIMKLNQSVYYMDNNVIVRDTIISIQTIESVVETKSESVVFTLLLNQDGYLRNYYLKRLKL